MARQIGVEVRPPGGASKIKGLAKDISKPFFHFQPYIQPLDLKLAKISNFPDA